MCGPVYLWTHQSTHEYLIWSVEDVRLILYKIVIYLAVAHYCSLSPIAPAYYSSLMPTDKDSEDQ